MKIESIVPVALRIPFRATFAHATAARGVGDSLWVRVRTRDGAVGHGEGCPRPYVTGEDLVGARRFVAAHAAQWQAEIRDLDSLCRWVSDQRALVDAHPAAWCAVELALLDALARGEGVSVEALTGHPEPSGQACYTAVLGDAPRPAFESTLARYRPAGFRAFKVKLVGHAERDAERAAVLRDAAIAPDALRADANNAWSGAEAAIEALARLPLRFAAYEEPLAAGDLAGLRRVSAALDRPIILDETACRTADLAPLEHDAARWIVNVRVSKMGGLLRALEFVQAARARGLRVVAGAHVGETSVLTRAALPVALAAGDALYGREGAFGTHLLARDVADPPLMFGPGGVLDADAAGLARRPGWGLAIAERTIAAYGSADP